MQKPSVIGEQFPSNSHDKDDEDDERQRRV
jgi:hypothetical protein